MSFEELDGAFVLFGGGQGFEGAQVAPLAAFGIFLARVEAVFAGFEFPDHWLARMR